MRRIALPAAERILKQMKIVWGVILICIVQLRLTRAENIECTGASASVCLAPGCVSCVRG